MTSRGFHLCRNSSFVVFVAPTSGELILGAFTPCGGPAFTSEVLYARDDTHRDDFDNTPPGSLQIWTKTSAHSTIRSEPVDTERSVCANM